MTPLTVNPIVVILTDGTGKPIKTATNVSPELKVVTTQRPEVFDELAKGRPFISRDVEQVWFIKDDKNFILEPPPAGFVRPGINELIEDAQANFPIGTQVNVARKNNDVFAEDFTGTVEKYRREFIQVRDQDGELWDCDPDQLTHCTDEIMHV